MAGKGVELAVGYISLVAETSQLTKDVDKTFSQVSRNAEQHGKRMGQSMSKGADSGFKFKADKHLKGGVKDAEGVGASMGRKMSGALSSTLAQGLATAGIAGGLAGVAAAFTSAIRSGIDYETGLNRIQGVTAATAAQMEQVNQKARELGNDVTLTGVSAQTAAQGMLELTKGGLSVEQAMEAARGTMALATAAGIDAGKAATIQADAINAFGLSASDASKVADNLANVANASTGELTDFAHGLQMSSAVANQFGMSVDQTVASLGLLANAGVKGSDAGTLIKSMLMALASPSEQQAGAIAELGLQVWDTTGAFVGMANILEQLHQASQELTPEMYAMHSSTAFGSDAARIGGVAARIGAAGFNEMRDAVNQVGGAARVAAANTQGLPGVFERLSNTTDRAKLAVTDLARGPLIAIGDAINSGINAAMDQFEGNVGVFSSLARFAEQAWPAIRDIGEALLDATASLASGAWGIFSTTLSNIASVLEVTVVPALRFIMDSGIGSVLTKAGLAWSAWKLASPILGGIHTGIEGLRDRLTGVAGPMRHFNDEMKVQQSLARLGGTELSRWGAGFAVIEAHVPTLGRMADAYRNTVAQGGHFNRTLGVMRGSMAGVHQIGSNMLSMLGGPWGAALTAATVGVTFWTQSVQQANQRAKTLEQSQQAIMSASREMYEEFSKAGGNVNDSVMAQVDEQVQALSTSFNELRRGAGIGDWIRTAIVGPFSDFDAYKIQETAEAHERMAVVMKDLKLDFDQVGAAVRGSDGEWSRLEQMLRTAADGGTELLDQIKPLREEFINSREAASNLTPGIVTLQEAMAVLADETSTAADKTNALKTAMDVLAGKQPDLLKATKTYNDVQRDLSHSTQETLDATQGWGDSMLDANGQLSTQTKNGSALHEQIVKLKDATAEVAGAGGDMETVFAQNEQALKGLAEQYGLNIEVVMDYAAQLGYIPEAIQTLINAETDDASQQIAAVSALLESLPPGQDIVINSLTEEAENALESVGAKIEHIEVHGKPQVKISLTGDAQVKGQLRDIINSMTNVPSQLTITSNLLTRMASDAPPLNPAERAAEGYLPVGPVAGGPPPAAPAADPTPLDILRNAQGRATGGSISGPGTATSDSVPILASNGEHMWSASEVAGAGGHRGVESLRSLARSGALRGVLPGFKDGGDPFGGGKKRTTEDWLSSIGYGSDSGGSGSAGGTDVEAALWYAYGQSGKPYDWGGAGEGGGSFDCSGYLSANWGVMTGRGPGRHFTTHSDFASMGFKKGYKAGAFNIGVHKGPTMDTSHMAGTMPDGSHVESGSDGVVFNGSTGALDEQFEEHWYYPVSADDPAVQRLAAQGWGAAGSGGGNTSFGSGGGAMGGGQSGVDGQTYGTSAMGDVARTEGWIPEGAGSTGVAGTSFAAGLLNMGSEAINGLIDSGAQMASQAVAAGVAAGTMGAGAAGAPAAGAAANWAIGIGTQAAKRGVSYGFQMASIGVDSLVEQLTPLGAPRWLGYDYTAMAPQMRGLPTGTTSTEEAMLAQDRKGSPPQGVSQDQWDQRLSEHWDFLPSNMGGSQQATQHGLGQGQNPGPPPGKDPWGTTTPIPTSGAAAAQQQQPQQPAGQSDWLRRIGVFDEGGMLPPGGIGVNLGSQPEPVFSPGQWDVLSSATESLQTAGVGANDYSIRIENLHVQDVANMQRELDSRQRLQMMRYAGRP